MRFSVCLDCWFDIQYFQIWEGIEFTGLQMTGKKHIDNQKLIIPRTRPFACNTCQAYIQCSGNNQRFARKWKTINSTVCWAMAFLEKCHLMSTSYRTLLSLNMLLPHPKRMTFFHPHQKRDYFFLNFSLCYGRITPYELRASPIYNIQYGLQQGLLLIEVYWEHRFFIWS